ncbi:hypothetical protein TWF217_005468, partial [Orbilia oligospora]
MGILLFWGSLPPIAPPTIAPMGGLDDDDDDGLLEFDAARSVEDDVGGGVCDVIVDVVLVSGGGVDDDIDDDDDDGDGDGEGVVVDVDVDVVNVVGIEEEK